MPCGMSGKSPLHNFPHAPSNTTTRYTYDFQTASEATSNPDASKQDQFVFGAGRRVCQGMHITKRSLFLAISRLLWGFVFKKALNAEWKEITPDIEDLTKGLIVFPRLFRRGNWFYYKNTKVKD
ncbi:hypothetical protein BJ878DRAFT_490517, partial [Calycina marina]